MNYKNRIIIFDGERHDRSLLALALRSADSNLEILEASTALEIAHHVSSGSVDALIADPGDAFAEVANLAAEIRKRAPQSLFWLFTANIANPSVRDCVGYGVDGRTDKTSAGFLSMPATLLERLRAARELRGRFPLDADAVFSGVFAIPACLLTKNGTIVAVNRELEETLERPRYELIDRAFDQLLAESERQDEWRRRFLVSHERWEFAANLKVTQSRILTMAITANPLTDVTSNQGLWAVNLLDVTRIIYGAPAGAVAHPESELDNVLYAVSHDLQAPLNSLASHARYLAAADDIEDTDARQAMQEIGALTTRMQLMLDGMLQVASVRANQREPEVVNLDAVVQDAMANLQSEVDETGATIERHPLPTLVVNRQQMVQVFQNLLANALKFRGNRIPRVRISAEENGDSVRLLVEDNGIGLDPKEAQRVFGMFQRLHSEREYPGIGMGLAICRQIVRAHGGDIFVESTPGRGTSFIIEFRGAALRSVISRNSRNGMTG
ncbi:MAG: sensor histidine kinase [Gammaproteobacteria bacterium]